MRAGQAKARRSRRSAYAAVCVWAALAVLTTAHAAGQETPASTPERPTQAQETVLRIDVGGPAQPIPEGDEFEARVLIDDVEHLAAFEFSIAYDPDRVSYERVEQQGEFLTSSERGENAFCPEPILDPDAVSVVCSTVGPPVCLGGLPGASGSGLLATVIFRSRGKGTATLDVRQTTLVSDDLLPCDLTTGATQSIDHRSQGAAVELEGDGGTSTVLVASVAAVVAAILLAAALAGFLWYRRRRGPREA